MTRITPLSHNQSKAHGFTLLEVMMVIVVIGVLMSAVQFTFQGNQSQQQLEKVSHRFAGVFELASEYGLLNNLELGLVVNEQSYQFMVFDGETWVIPEEVDALQTVELPENIAIELTLDDLPVENSLLGDAQLLFNQEQDDFKKDKDKQPKPQVFILSGGDISPFSVSFYFIDAFDAPDISYKVTGLYTTPLNVEGPFGEGYGEDDD